VPVYFEGPREGNEASRVARLTGQICRVFDLMSDGQPRTLEEIAEKTGDPPASVSAQLRHLRKDRFGGFVVEKEHLGDGLYVYWIPLDADGQPARKEES